MPLLDIFKRKKRKEGEEKEEKIEKEIKPEKKIIKREVKKVKPEEVKVEKPPEIVTPKVKEKKIGEAYRILKIPHVTEKSTDLAGKNQYVFRVWEKSNKVEIKKAIEQLYGVDVLDVKIIKILPKKRRLGRIWGWRKGYKKAIVKIKEGQKIEIMPR